MIEGGIDAEEAVAEAVADKVSEAAEDQEMAAKDEAVIAEQDANEGQMRQWQQK